MEYKKLLDPIEVLCAHCGKNYTQRSNIDQTRYPKYCPSCSLKYGHIVYRCSLCNVLHFHNFQHCSLCPGVTIGMYVFPKDGVMNDNSSYRAGKEAGENNPGKW